MGAPHFGVVFFWFPFESIQGSLQTRGALKGFSFKPPQKKSHPSSPQRRILLSPQREALYRVIYGLARIHTGRGSSELLKQASLRTTLQKPMVRRRFRVVQKFIHPR